MKTIPLTQGYEALVDDGDYEKLNKYKWRVHKSRNTLYAVRWNEVRKLVWMHKIILQNDLEVDHKDNDGLNNQQYNLRPATSTQNKANRLKQSNTSSKFKGVTKRLRSNGWQARIRNINLGMFELEEDAARAYDNAARRLFKEFAKTNF